jgi:hypothetical protein
VRPTPPAALVAAGVAGTVVGFGLASLADRLGYGLPRVSWVSIGLLLFLAVLLVVSSRRVTRWVSGDRPAQPGDALRMGRMVALGKAASVFGAVMTGGYLGLAAAGLPRLPTEYAREHVAWAVGGALAGGAVLVAAIVLERSCRLPGDGEQAA